MPPTGPASEGARPPAAVFALVIASVMWGTTGAAASFLPAAVSPIAIGASTMTVGGLLLFLVSLRSARAAIADRRSLRWLLVGAVGVFVYPLAFYSGMDLAGVAIGNVVALGSGPVFAALLEWLWERHVLSARWAVCTAIAVAGIVLLSMGRHPDASTADSSVVAGVILGLLAGLAYATYTYASSRAIALGHPGRGVMGAMFGLGAVALAPVLAFTGAPLLQAPLSIGIAAYLAVFPMFIAYILFGFGLKFVRSSVATTITLIEPIVATMLAILVVGERLEWVGWIGLALILLGVTLLVSARQPTKDVEPS